MLCMVCMYARSAWLLMGPFKDVQASLHTSCRLSQLQAVAQLGMDPAANPGAKMLARMGFGTTGGRAAGWA